MNTYDKLRERLKDTSHPLADKFNDIFGTPLSAFWDCIFGFDVVAFDKFIRPRKHESTYEAITRKYGDEALTVVATLTADSPLLRLIGDE